MKIKLIKKGLLFNCNYLDKELHTALQPTAICTGNNTARIFCGARDGHGISRVMYVDIKREGEALEVTNISSKPVLDVGLPGCFDDNGVVPTAVVGRGDELHLYYAGYQLPINPAIRFLVLGGLAISKDGGNSFERLKNTPVMERTDKEFLFRVPHSVMYEKGKWRIWYGGGKHFDNSNNKLLPVYDIRYMESNDGISFPEIGTTVLPNSNDEYRVGRPNVFKKDGKYIMFFGASTAKIQYRLAYAISEDGHTWQRGKDLGLEYGKHEFDSDMSAYPCALELGEKTYMLYNGNEYGKAGFGYAEVVFE